MENVNVLLNQRLLGMNQSDKELLELAAKAAGYSHVGYDTNISSGKYMEALDIGDRYWNPLTDDGDALRLAVKLNLDINCYSKSVETSACLYSDGISHRCIERTNQDKYAATRRAIVRAAAEIGKTI